MKFRDICKLKPGDYLLELDSTGEEGFTHWYYLIDEPYRWLRDWRRPWHFGLPCYMGNAEDNLEEKEGSWAAIPLRVLLSKRCTLINKTRI